MKHFTHTGTFRALLGFVLTFFLLPGQSWAQCGTASALTPVASASQLCSGNTLKLSVQGVQVSTWIYRDNNGSWQNTFSGNQPTYSTTVSVSANVTREYRAIINHSTCSNDTTAGVSISLLAASYGNNSALVPVSSTLSTCSNNSATVAVPANVTVKEWVYRDNNSGSWMLYSSGNNTTMSVSASASSTPVIRSLRAIVARNSGCAYDTSAAVSITFNPAGAGTRSDIVPVPTATQVCSGTNTQASVSSTLSVQYWIYRDNNGSWQINYSGNNFSVSTSTTSATTTREARVIVSDLNSCRMDTSAPVIFTISLNRGNNNTIVPTANNTSECAGNTVSVSAPSNLSGLIQGWLRRDNNTGTWSLFSTSSTSYNDFSTNVSTTTTRAYRVLFRNTQSCSIDTSAEVTVTLQPNTYGNNNNFVPLATNSNLCSGAQATIRLNGNAVTIQNWVYRNNNTGNWFAISGGNTLNDFNTSVTSATQRSYRAVLRDITGCRFDTSAAANVTIRVKTYTGGTTLQIQPTSTTSGICAGNNAQASISISGQYGVEKWIYADASTWNDVSGSSGTNLFDFNTNVTSAVNRSYKALITNLETCVIDTSLSTSVNISPRQYGTNLQVVPQPVQNTYCSGSSFIQVNATIPSGYSVQSWLYRNNNTGNWIQGSGGTSFYDYSTTVSTTTTRSYRVLMVNNNLCRVDTSSEVSVTITPRTNGYNTSVVPTSTTTTICSGNSLSASVSLSSGLTVARWIWRDNNTGLWNIINTTSTSVNQNNLFVLVNTTRELKVVLNNNTNCSVDTSAGVTFQIQPLTGGIVSAITPSASQTAVCAGNSISTGLGSGNSSTFIRWYLSDNGSPWYEPVSYSQSSNMFDSETRVNTTTSRRYRYVYYRSNGLCVIDTTQHITVNITPLGAGSMLSKGVNVNTTQVCAGNSTSVSVSLSSGEQVSRWLYRDNNGPWGIATTSTSSSFNDNNTRVNSTTTREYRAILYNSNGCTLDTTQSGSVTLVPVTQSNNASVTPIASNTTVCGDASVSISVNPGTGNNVRQWLFNNNNGNWMVLNTSNSSSFTHQNATVPAGVNTRSYRVLLNDVVNCGIDTSAAVTLNIQSLQGGQHSVSPTGSATVCATSTSNSLSISLPSGYSATKWMYNNNGGAWTDFPFSTANSSINDVNLNTAGITTRSYSVIMRNNNTCRMDTSAVFVSTIYPTVGGTLSTSVPNATSTNVCFGGNAQLSITVPSGYTVQKWMYNDNGTGWKNFASSTASSSITDNHTQVSTTVTRAYLAILNSTGSCRRDSSAATSITINPRNSFGNSTANPNASPSGGICNGSSVQLSVSPGTGNNVERWIYRDNNGVWNDVVASNFSGIVHNNTYISSSVSRTYRALINNTSACRLDTTNGVSVNISMQSYGSDTNMTISSNDTLCAGTNAFLSISASGTIRKWMYRDNNGPWMDIPNSGFTSITETNTSVSTTTSRTYAVLVFKNSLCRIDTSKLRTVVIRPISAGNSMVKANITIDSVCVGTSSLFMSVPSSVNVKQWIYRDNFSGNWTAIPSSANTTYNHTLSGLAVNTPREYRAILISTSCTEDTTAGDTVVIKAYTRGNNSVVAPSISNASLCNGAPAFVNVTPGSGNTVIKWIYRNNNTGPWIDYQTGGNSISDYNTFVTTPQTRVYRVILRNNNTCSEDTSASLTLSLLPVTNGNTTTTPTVSNSTVCTGSGVTVSVNPGSGNSVQRWMFRNGSTGNWTDLAFSGNSITDNNTITGTTLVRNYRAIIYNPSTCSRDTTPAVSVTITPVTVGVNTSITPTTSSSNVCTGNPFSVNVSTGGGSVVGWLYNVNGGNWINFGYTTSTSITDYQTTYAATTTKAYRALIYTSSTCRIDTTNSLTVTINPRTYGNDNSYTFTSPTTACAGSSFNMQISALGSGNSIARWIYSDNNGAWMNLNTSSTSFTETNTNVSSTTTRVYRALIIKGGACTVDTSNARTVTINMVAAGNDNTITPSGPSSVCAGASASISVAPGTGNSVQRWLYRNNNSGPWLVYSFSSNTSFIEYNTSVSSTSTRQYRALIYKSASCRLDTSAEYVLTMSPRTAGNLSVTPTTGNSTICTGASVTVNVSLSGGTVQSWIYRDNSGNWNTLAFTTSTSVTDFNTSVSSTTTRTYRALVQSNSGCTLDTTNGVTVTINPRVFGNISNTPNAGASTVCSGNSVTVGVSVSGTVLRWLWRDNATGNWNIWNTSSNNITDYNTTVSSTVTRSYRAIVQSATGCSVDTTAAANVTINPVGRGNNSMQPTTTTATVCAGSAAAVSVNPGSSVVLGWLYRDNSTGNWNAVNFSAASSISDNNTNVMASTSRVYRALVYTASACSYDTTLGVTVTLNPVGQGNINTLNPVAVNGTVCSGEPASISLSTSLPVMQWLMRTDGGNWQTVNSSSLSYVDFATSTTAQQIREYRAIVRNTNCSNDTTASVSVTIRPYTYGNSSSSPSASQSMICAGNSLVVSIGGNVQSWIYRDNNSGNWINSGSSNNTFIQNNTFVSQVTVRSIRALLANTANCSYDTSAAVEVTINPNTTGNVSVQPVATNAVICSNNPAIVKINGHIGQVTRWIYRDNNGAWNNISLSATDSLVHTATAVTALTNREYRAIVFTGCSTDTTLAVAVTIDVFPAIPVITQSGDTLICNIATGVTYRWIRNGLDAGGSSQKFIPTQSGNYVIEVSNTNGCKSASLPFNYIKTGVATMEWMNAEVYPNPTGSGRVNIRLSRSCENGTITIMQATGQIMETIRIQATDALEIDLSKYAQGLYFIRIEADGAHAVKQVLYR